MEWILINLVILRFTCKKTTDKAGGEEGRMFKFFYYTFLYMMCQKGWNELSFLLFPIFTRRNYWICENFWLPAFDGFINVQRSGTPFDGF